MEDLWLPATVQGHLQCNNSELPVKAVAELPAEHTLGEDPSWPQGTGSLLGAGFK